MSDRIDPFDALEPYARVLLQRALGRDGVAPFSRPRHAGLVRALGNLLREPSPPPEQSQHIRSELLRRAPDLAPHVALLERCAERLADVLAGRVLASDVLFPGGSMDVVEPVYRGNRWSDHFNALTAKAVVQAVSACRVQHPGAVVRILEVGAGTGGTSGAVLAGLDPHAGHVVYDYTDISPGFVQHGRRVHGAGRSYFSGRVLDLERPPVEQGYAAGTYDIVLGTNVLHATSHVADALRHINWLLRKGGLLLVNEIMRAGAFATMTFGLLDGWWAFRDAELREPDAPVISPRGWKHLLPTLGFNEPAVFGWNDAPEASFQCLLVAAKVGEGATEARSAAARPGAGLPTEAPEAPGAVGSAPRAAAGQELRSILAGHLGTLLGLSADDLAYDQPMREFGVDSIIVPQYVTLLNRELGSALVPTDIFNCVTLSGLADHLAQSAAGPRIPVTLIGSTVGARPPAPAASPGPLEAPSPVRAPSASDIAVIGLACRFPGAPDSETFWSNLVAGRSSITEVPETRWDGRADGKVRWGGFLDEHDCFDPEFFNLSWREAEAMSPQQRVFLEQAWNALENAGYGRRSLAGRRCGVFVGAAPDGYGIHDNDSLSSLGGSLAILSARISYLLDLKGPSLPLDTACSSSLVAVHLACQSLLTGDCDMALAGGVSILMTDGRLHSFLDDAGMLSATGRCHTFDAAADGFVPGEGVGVVVLKRLGAALADGDNVVGVIKASSINQDGRSSGITAPNGPSQTALELAVYERAGIAPAEVGLVEAHGTGTQLGDPIEVNALTVAFRRSTDRRGFCALGSVKTNIGHTLTAAGVAGLIKVLLALKHGTIPPSLNFASANPEIDFAGGPFFVPRQAMPWMGSSRHGAVSSFGFSGTNAHVLLAEAPILPRRSEAGGPALILLSGRTAEALEARRQDLLRWLETHTPSLTDLAFTLGHGRTHFEHRLALLVESVDDLRSGRFRSWRSEALVLPARSGQEAALDRLLSKSSPDLVAIAECYVTGGDGDWSRLAAPGARRLALPGYPFARRRFPVRSSRGAAATVTIAPQPTAQKMLGEPPPMLGARVIGDGEPAFEIGLDPQLAWLRDHRLGDSSVVPAVAYLELARAAAAAAIGAPAGGLSDVRFEHPMIVGQVSAPRIVLRPAGSGGQTFQIVDASGLIYVSGRALTGSDPDKAALTDLAKLSERLPRRFSSEEVYEQFARLGFNYGPSLRVIRSLRASEREVLAEIGPAVSTRSATGFDPALMDGAIQAAVGVMLTSREPFASVVPVGIASVKFHAAVSGPCLAHVSLLSETGTRRRLDIRVLDAAGRPLVEFGNVEVRVALSGDEGGPTKSDHPVDGGVHLFAPAWEEEPLAGRLPPSNLLLFDRDESLWRRMGDKAVLVVPGSTFLRLDERRFAIDPASAPDYERLCSVLRAEGRLPRTAWCLWSWIHGSVDPATATPNVVAEVLRDGLHAVAHLCRALARTAPVEPIVILHAHGDTADEAPLQAPVAGFAMALAAESPLLQLVSVGIGSIDLEQRPALLAAETEAAREGAAPRLRASRWDTAGRRRVRRLQAASVAGHATAKGLRDGATVLLTGALGGIGPHVARDLAQRHKARLLLVGRRAAGLATESLISDIRAAGGDAHYFQADVSDEAQAFAAAAAARARFGALHAVIHAAGVTRDRFLLHKTPEDFVAVLGPKLAGTLALDRATAHDPLDVFVCFSSMAGTFGNAGQTDYSAANRFLDAYVAARRGPGRSISMGWPFWRDGGLTVDQVELDRRQAATGIRVLGTKEGLVTLDAAMAGVEGAVVVLPGDGARIARFVAGGEGKSAAGSASPVVSDANEGQADGTSVEDAVLDYLRALVAQTTAMPPERIHPDRPLEQYGLDSLLVTKLNVALEARLPGLPKTLFFEHPTLRGVAGFLAATRAEAFRAPAGTTPSRSVDAPVRPAGDTVQDRARASSTDGIAIIGIAGRFPGADSLDAFWENLVADRDLITEIPADRWDHAPWFDATPGKAGRSYSKWGGFLQGIDGFDPLFFNIAPGEAARIDPNERLFLEVCWEALENSGHTRASLAPGPARAVGVYAGVMYGEYQLLAAQAQAAGGGAVEGSSPYWSVANRVSYHFDLHGPSITVDSACSSSLTAIHLACQALASGECSAAIAGGVNLNLHPLKYVGLSQGRFAATDGRCHSFAAGGDGYVPGEGVGAVILKPLAAALADGDFIHAVIRGWAANHGGKTSGYTVPNPKSQGAVIEAALRRGGVAPHTITYVEAHGTGTELGDPIEIAGLAAAFGDGVSRQSCALGSVKANIGHLEAAAGVAGLARVVLQLQHRMLTPTRSHGPANPNIDFAATPFHLQDRAEPWTGASPLRAGVSSFGAGGANAHLVIEEFRPERQPAAASDESALLILSARTEAQLKAYAGRLAGYLRHKRFRFLDICRTLQVGREPLSARLALIAADPAAAAEALEAFASGHPSPVVAGVLDEEFTARPVATGMTLDELARAWIDGATIAWRDLPLPGSVVPVPPRPFMRRRYWLDGLTKAAGSQGIHPFLDRAEPSLDGARFVKRFDPEMPVVRDHKVQSRHLVPGVVQLEMVYAALAAAGGKAAALRNVVWPAPLAVTPSGMTVTVLLRRTPDTIGFELSDENGGTVCRGQTGSSSATPARLEIETLRAGAQSHLSANEIYERLNGLGLEYGPSLRALTDIWTGGAKVVAALAESKPLSPAMTLPPAILDGALQSLLGFAGEGPDRLFVPFSLSELRLHGEAGTARFVVATRRPADGEVAVFDLSICDSGGEVLIELAGLAARPTARQVPVAGALPLSIRVPRWQQENRAGDIAPAVRVLVVHEGDDLGLTEGFGEVLGQGQLCQSLRSEEAAAIAQAMESATDLIWIAAGPSEGRGVAECAAAQALDLLHAIQAMERAGRLARGLHLRVVTRGFQSVTSRERPDPHAGALIGLAKSVVHEYPRVAVTLTDLAAAEPVTARHARAILTEPASSPVRETAWRAGVRFVQVLQAVTLPPPVVPVRPGSVVLIVGGAGGIGRVLAGWLARDCGARVVLVGRRPEAEVAPEVAAVSTGNGSVRYLQADTTDANAMAEVVAATRALWGGIDAAIHAALVLRDRTISRMDDDTFHAALAPKIAGSVALAEALADEPLQFFAFLSSINVLSGSRGQSNYVAGSSFADAFARYLAAERPWRVVVTDWGLWGDVGVVSDEIYRQRLARQGVHPILPTEGIATLAAILNSTADRVAVIRADAKALRQLGFAAESSRPPDEEAEGGGDGASSMAEAEMAFAALEQYARVALATVIQGMAEGTGGKAWTTEGLRRKLGIAARHAALFPALLEALGNHGLLDASNGLWRMKPVTADLLDKARSAVDDAVGKAPWLAGPRRLLQTCLDAYEPMLRGTVDPVSVLFPQASMTEVEAAYAGHPIADRFNAEICTAVRTCVDALPPGRILRLIELGAGTGATTAVVLEALARAGVGVEYLATDVSQRFLAHGAERFAGRSGVAFAIYDAELDAEANGVEAGSFDIVLAANVLHATSNLAATLARVRRLLRPRGRLLLSEATRAQDFGTMVFGLTPGWWLAKDRPKRIAHSPLVSVEGWRALLAEAGFDDVRAVTAGAASSDAPHALLIGENREAFASASMARAGTPIAAAPPEGAAAPRVIGGGERLPQLHRYLRELLADVLKLDGEDIRLNEGFDRYGLESLTALEIRNRLDRDIPGLPATLLFEHNTLARLAAWLADAHADSVARLFPDATGKPDPGRHAPPAADPAPADPVVESVPARTQSGASADEPIAIIGFSGRYPGGPDSDSFWRLLQSGESAIREVPEARWNAASVFDTAGGEGRSYSKWAGFIDDVDCFDPLFFNISPLEAEVMDPQERLFLQTAWTTLEQAGYTPSRLRERAAAASAGGADVGVFVGAMNAPYQWIAAQAWSAGHANAASTGYWSIANRVSFLMDFSGPSLVIDTACSASLTAIHLACESLRRGECGAALAGGVNLILHPRQFVNLSQARMISRGAECRAFGAGADGFVDGEGVGAVLLKPLSAAERDGDRIEGVILGSAVNSGGRTSGFTVPNPRAQARVIDAALRRAGLAPEAISYVEAHGTGTALGDPIEIAGLAEALGGAERGRCFVGAVKANIGHLESAAGVAGLTKVLLQLRHRTIAPLRHASTPNPLIDLASTPFALPTEAMAWQPAEQGGKLRAGVSSFGAGGANAHLVIEEYPAPRVAESAAGQADLVVLSARDADQLRVVVQNLLAFLRATPVRMTDLAHTLRVGREAMASRLAVVADDAASVAAALAEWLEGRAVAGVSAAVAATDSARMLSETEEGQSLLAGLMARRDLRRLGQLWAEGADLDWRHLPSVDRPRLIVLPTYPFRRERYWLPSGGAAPVEQPVDRARTVPEPSRTASELQKMVPAESGSAEPDESAELAGAAMPDRPARIQLFTRTWQSAPMVLAREPTRVLVLARDPGLAKRLAALWPAPVVAVVPGPGLAFIDEQTVQLDPFSEADHAALMARVARQEPEGFAVVQALDWPGAAHPAQNDGARASIILTQVVQRGGASNVRILHVFADADERPLDQAVGSLARSAVQESNSCLMRAVGIAGRTTVDVLAEICRNELLSPDDAPEVLYRDGIRHVPQIEPAAVDPEVATIGFRIGGAYLLVGGLGEVGCAIAERLAREYRARIAIIGRSDPRGPALERLRRLSDAGIQVHYEACDLNDRAGLERAMGAIRGHLGRLHGVLHLARTVEDALLVRKTAASVARVMAAKVEGSILLDAVLADEELDWFVLCSSLAAWLGLAGGGDYALACAFQSGFARLRHKKVEAGERHGRTVAICWPQWQYDRYLNSAKLRKLASVGLQTIDARDGLRIIVQALQSHGHEVAAVKGSEPAFRRLTLAYRPDTAPTAAPAARGQDEGLAAELHSMTDAELAAYLEHLASFESPAQAAAEAQSPESASESAETTGEPVEAVIVETICSFLKLPRERFGAESEFAEFGLDSIKALHVAERLQKQLGVQVDPAMFFEFPRIGQFARAVAAHAASQAGRVKR
jgi:acyl transferase domain-containing protein/NAD(P)-dependent dehydrogenase (short-subunit alcohol dehydrogenase family)/SAM-dependent methyltransferase/acyl carrier protein